MLLVTAYLHLKEPGMDALATKINHKYKIEYGTAEEYSRSIHKYAVAHQIDPALLAAVIATESSFNRHAKGTKGEVGLMQLRPEYFNQYDIDTPDVNVACGAAFLGALKGVYGPIYKDYRWLEHYNQGSYAKPKHFYYTAKVLENYAYFRGTDGQGLIQQAQKLAKPRRGARQVVRASAKPAHKRGRTKHTHLQAKKQGRKAGAV